MLKQLFGETEFYKTFFKLAIPVTLQYFFAASLNLIDNIMVGQLGEVQLAAVGLANQVYFFLLMFLLGISSGASMFAAQFWGKQDLKNIRRILGLSIMISSSSAALFFIISVTNSSRILGMFSQDQPVVHLGSQFLTITSFSYILIAITACYAAVLRSTGEVKLPMRVNVIALLVNTALNFILIFGMFGFPKLGVIGSGIATLVARLVEISILLTVTYCKKYIVAGKLSELLDIPVDLTKRFISATASLVVKDGIWAIGVIIYMVIYAKMGTHVVASLNIVTTIRQLAFVLFNGIASACLVMVGNQIGAGEEGKSYLYAKRFLIIAALTGLVIGLVVLLSCKLLLLPYHVSAQVLEDSKNLLYAFAAFLPVIVFNMIAIVGIFRGGGDNTFCLIMDFVVVYLIGLPLAFLGQSVWNYSVTVVFILINLQEIFKFVLCIKRFISKKWIKNLVADFIYEPVTLPE